MKGRMVLISARGWGEGSVIGKEHTGGWTGNVPLLVLVAITQCLSYKYLLCCICMCISSLLLLQQITTNLVA